VSGGRRSQNPERETMNSGGRPDGMSSSERNAGLSSPHNTSNRGKVRNPERKEPVAGSCRIGSSLQRHAYAPGVAFVLHIPNTLPSLLEKLKFQSPTRFVFKIPQTSLIPVPLYNLNSSVPHHGSWAHILLKYICM
jgi:hypothetical protein